MLTLKFHNAALFIHPDRAAAVAREAAARWGGSATVTQKLRRLMDRYTVEHGYAVTVAARDGNEYYVAEA